MVADGQATRWWRAQRTKGLVYGALPSLVKTGPYSAFGGGETGVLSAPPEDVSVGGPAGFEAERLRVAFLALAGSAGTSAATLGGAIASPLGSRLDSLFASLAGLSSDDDLSLVSSLLRPPPRFPPPSRGDGRPRLPEVTRAIDVGRAIVHLVTAGSYVCRGGIVRRRLDEADS